MNSLCLGLGEELELPVDLVTTSSTVDGVLVGKGISNVEAANFTMMLHGVGLREEIGVVVDAGLPFDAEVALFDAIADPVVAQVDGLGAFFLDRVESKSNGALVVACDERGWLFVSQLSESLAKGFRLFSD